MTCPQGMQVFLRALLGPWVGLGKKNSFDKMFKIGRISCIFFSSLFTTSNSSKPTNSINQITKHIKR